MQMRAFFEIQKTTTVVAIAIVAMFCNPTSAQVISATQIKFQKDSSQANQYDAITIQTPAGDPTAISFNYTGTTLNETSISLDEGSDWFLTNAGDIFSTATIGAGQFPVLFDGDDSPAPTLAIPLGDFYFGVNTGTGAENSPTFRDVYGWIELDNTGSALIPVDNAVAYGDQGIIIGTTTAVPEPGSAAIAMLATLPLLLRRSKRA